MLGSFGSIFGITAGAVETVAVVDVEAGTAAVPAPLPLMEISERLSDDEDDANNDDDDEEEDDEDIAVEDEG